MCHHFSLARQISTTSNGCLNEDFLILDMVDFQDSRAFLIFFVRYFSQIYASDSQLSFTHINMQANQLIIQLLLI